MFHSFDVCSFSYTKKKKQIEIITGIWERKRKQENMRKWCFDVYIV